MTEAEWTTCRDPQVLFGWSWVRGKRSERKDRLIALALCRRFWSLLDERSRRAVDVADRYAEGGVPEDVLDAVWDPAWAAVTDAHQAAVNAERDWSSARWDLLSAAQAAARTLAGEPETISLAVAFGSLHSPTTAGQDDEQAFVLAKRQELDFHCCLIRDLLGPLPIRPVVLPPALLTWQGGLVVRLAEGIYENRAFTPDRLSVLADALEEAGCSDPDLVGHLRGPGPHVRGCWVIDLILGKE